ncbi:MAG: DUF6055 domain-containing protein, partial [Desulfatiglandales bacterium]
MDRRRIATVMAIYVGLLIWVEISGAETFTPKEGGLPPSRDLTFEMVEIWEKWDQLTPEEKAIYGSYYLPYPVGSNFKGAALLGLVDASQGVSNANIVYTEHFRLIWGKGYQAYVKKDSPYYYLWGDSDGDGYPNFIEYLLGSDPYSPSTPYPGMDYGSGILESTWGKIVDEWHFKAPPWSDYYYIDIYMANTGVYNPSVISSILPGNPTNVEIKLGGYYYGLTSVYQNGVPFILINQNMSISTLKVTFAHEFFHAVQLAYLPYEQLSKGYCRFLAESTSTWMEDAVYPEIDNYVQYVKYWLDYPEDSLFSDGYSSYGGVLFLKYLTENFHHVEDPLGIQIIKGLWEDTEQSKNPLEAISKFLKEQNVRPVHNLKDAYTEFAIRNLDVKNSYKDGSKYKEIYLLKNQSIDLDKTSIDSLTVDLCSYAPAPYGANYMKISTSSNEASLANRLFLNFDYLYSFKKTQPDFRVYVIVEGQGGGKSNPVLVAFKDLKEGRLFKLVAEGVKSFYIVVVGLPKDEQNLDPGERYFYKVSYNVYDGNLKEGWNLVSAPKVGEPDLEWLEGKYSAMWKWDPEKTTWHLIFPDKEEALLNQYLEKRGFKKITFLQEWDGVWLNMKESLEPQGASLEKQGLSLKKGWNL